MCTVLVEGNSRFCKVAFGIPKIPGNSRWFRESNSVAGAQEGTPPNGAYSGPPVHWCVWSALIQEGKTQVPIIPIAICTGPDIRIRRPFSSNPYAEIKEFFGSAMRRHLPANNSPPRKANNPPVKPIYLPCMGIPRNSQKTPFSSREFPRNSNRFPTLGIPGLGIPPHYTV